MNTKPSTDLVAVALHGFVGSGEDFEVLAAHLPWTLLTPDLPGHGRHHGLEVGAAVAASMEEAIKEIAGLLQRPSAGPPVLLGYSMGGRVALQLACRWPELLRGLVLIGATPGLQDPDLRAERVRSDEALASFVESRGVPAFMDRWEEHPVIVSQRRIASEVRGAMRRRRLENRAEGLAASLRGMGTGTMEPCWDRLGSLALPVLLITGEEDDKFTAIAARMAELLPRASHHLVPEAGHCAHLEQPQLVGELIRDFIDGL